MSQTVSILEIDQNPGNWISQFLISNQQQVTGTIQDKITTLYLLQNARMLNPVSLDDIFQLSPSLLQGIVLANQQPDQGERINKLAALILLYNLGAIDQNDHTYISNPRFNEVFLSNDQLSNGRDLRSALIVRPVVAAPSVPTRPVVATPSAPTRPVVATPSAPITVGRAITVTRPTAVDQRQATETRTITENGRRQLICQMCQSWIFNDRNICGMCSNPEEMPEQIRLEIENNFDDYDPNFEDFYDQGYDLENYGYDDYDYYNYTDEQ